ncbi:MAG: DUF975 family protein [Bacillota bacterium]
MVNGALLKTNSELNAMARARLQGNWGKSILICFIFAVLISVGGSTAYLLGPVVNLVITGPLTFGLYKYFMQFRKEEEPPVEVLFDGLKVFVTSFVLYLLTTIFTVLWTLLLIVPGIIAALSYSMSFYILNDNPELKAMEAINKSKEMMNGQKGKLFMLSLRFIGWLLLSILTLGIGFLWLVPYYQTAKANFYEDLKNAEA